MSCVKLNTFYGGGLMARIKTTSSDQYVHTFDFEEGEELLVEQLFNTAIELGNQDSRELLNIDEFLQ